MGTERFTRFVIDYKGNWQNMASAGKEQFKNMVKPHQINVREKMEALIPSRSYATHGIDRYPAKMIPHLARFAIQQCTVPGQAVLDPFCGCGTVLVEARISDRRATGIDINPLAILLAGAKSHIYYDELLNDAINRVIDRVATDKLSDVKFREAGTPSKKQPEWLDYWFSPNTLRQLLSLRRAIETEEGEISPSYIDAMKAILAVVVRLSSKADPRSPKPFISKKARRERVGHDFDAVNIFSNEGKKFIKATAEFRTRASNDDASFIDVFCDDARNLEHNIKLGQFNAVVSSPPYLTAQDYYRSSKLEIAILGLMKAEELRDLGPAVIGSGRGKQDQNAISKLSFIPSEIEKLSEIDFRASTVVATFLNDMARVTRGCYKHLSDDGRCCLIIGNSTIRGIKLPVHKWIIKIVEQAGFYLDRHFIDTVRDRHVPPIRQGHTSVINQEHILIFAKSI